MTDSPYAANACPGPCNRRYRKAVDAHPTALTAYEFAVDRYAAALPEYQRAVIAWDEHVKAGGLVLVEPRPPTHPGEPPAPPSEYRAGDPVWCPHCTGAIRHALPNIDDLASLLDSWADGHRGATATQKYGTTTARAHPGSPSPIGDTLDELYGALVEVEDQWREHRGYPKRPQRARDGRARRLTLAFLLGELADILGHPGSVAFGRGVLAWERRLQALTTSEPVIHRRPAARCPNETCRQRTLWTRADGMIECRNPKCGRLMHEHEYAELVARDDGSVERAEETISA